MRGALAIYGTTRINLHHSHNLKPSSIISHNYFTSRIRLFSSGNGAPDPDPKPVDNKEAAAILEDINNIARMNKRPISLDTDFSSPAGQQKSSEGVKMLCHLCLVYYPDRNPKEHEEEHKLNMKNPREPTRRDWLKKTGYRGMLKFNRSSSKITFEISDDDKSLIQEEAQGTVETKLWGNLSKEEKMIEIRKRGDCKKDKPMICHLCNVKCDTPADFVFHLESSQHSSKYRSMCPRLRR